MATMKQTIRTAIESTRSTYDDLRKKAQFTFASDAYTPEEKERRITGFADELQRHIDSQKAEMKRLAERKVEALNVEEEKAQATRNSSPSHQQLLTSALTIIPHIDLKSDAECENMRKRLAVFKDDPLAISTLRGAINNIARNQKKNGETGLEMNMHAFDILPEDTNGKRQEMLTQEISTVSAVLDHVVSGISGDARASDIFIRAGMDEQLLNLHAFDDDCTTYDEDRPEFVKAVMEWNEKHDNRIGTPFAPKW